MMGKLGIVALRRRSDRGHGGIGIFLALWRKEREVTQWYHQDPDKEGGVTVNIERDSYDYARYEFSDLENWNNLGKSSDLSF